MRNIIYLVFAVLLWALSKLPVSPCSTEQALSDSASLAALGFVVLAGHLLGKWLNNFGLPQVTGYMIAGILAGPYISGVLEISMLERLKLIDQIALVLIALAAGGELRMPDLKTNWKVILSVLFSQTTVILLFSITAVVMFGGIYFEADDYGLAELLAIGLILGVMTAANSPSVAVAVIKEMKAHGRLTNLVMSVTVPKDVVVIVLFAAAMSFASGTLGAESGNVLHAPLPLLLTGSLILGSVGGFLLILYLKYIGRQIELGLLILTIILIKLVDLMNLELLFTAVTMGFIVQNFSEQGKKFIAGLTKVSSPVFVVFFAFAGAAIDLPLLREIAPLAVFWALLRAFGIWFGTGLGQRFIAGSYPEQKLTWLGYLPQAGVALGMTSIVAVSLPDVGGEIRTLILAVVAINQILGPIGFRYALIKAGETGRSLH